MAGSIVTCHIGPNSVCVSEQYRNLAEGKSGEEIFDDCLYKEVKENGILLGCPLITESLAKMAEELDFPIKEAEPFCFTWKLCFLLP
ncbi:MAG: hypothetical protein CM1200mP30_29270 [Pseudomonadota bacterium]|nr:MAG: hypothetical protein CM1200mP30_29270 [Pseudomonadota bacterium]